MDLKFVTIRDEVLKTQREKLEFLRKHYEANEKYKTSFEDVIQQYIEHLIVKVASKGINQHQDISPPLHVEAFWKMHLMETESYRDLESLVLEKMRKHSPVSTEHVKYIDHSSVNQPNDVKSNLETTKVMYTFFGFEFKDERGLVESDEQGNDQNGQSDGKSNNIKSKSSGNSEAKKSNDDDDDDSSDEILSHDRVEKMIQSLKLENLPPNIKPIPSNNACKYRGVTFRNDIYTSTLHWRSKRYTVYKGNEKENDKEIAAKMFSWAYKIAHGEDAYNNAISTSYSSEDNSEADDESSSASSLEDHINETKTREASNKGAMSADEIIALGKEMSSVEERDIPKHCLPIESSRNSNGYQGIQKHTAGYAVDFFFNSRHFVINGDKPWSLIGAAKMYAWFYELVRGKEALEKLRKTKKTSGVKRKDGAANDETSSKKRKSMSEAQGQDISKSVQESEKRNNISVSVSNKPNNGHEEHLRAEDGSNISKQADKTSLNQQPEENQNEQQIHHSNNLNVQQQNNAEIQPKMELGTSSTSQIVRVKSEIQTEPGRVQVGVKGTLQGQEITKFFRVKTKIKCSRLVKSWCESHGINQNPEDWQYIRYNGKEVDPSTTIAALGLKSLEILEVLRGGFIE